MIENVNANLGQREIPAGFNLQGAAQEGISPELVQQVSDILAGTGVRINVVDKIIDDIVEQLSVPELAEADVVAIGVDLALLAELMKIEGEKYKAKIDKALIDKQNADIDAQTKERLAKLNETLKKMDKAAKMNKFMKIFGWVMVAVSIAIAAATCGAAGGLVVGAVVAAATATALQVLNETGVTEKFTKAVGDLLKSMGADERTAAIVSAVFVAALEIALSIVSGQIGSGVANKFNKIVEAGMKAGLSAEQATALAMKQTVMRTMECAMKSIAKMCRHMPKIMKGFQYMMMALKVGGQIGSADANYKYGIAKSVETKAKAVLKQMMKALEEMMDALEELLAQLMNGDADVLKILLNADETNREIARRLPPSMA